MECSCIRRTGQKFDFYLDLLDCDTIVFTDLSNWMDEDYYVIPDLWPMNIKLPNNSVKQVFFKPRQSTIFTKAELGLILDGIYCFSTNSCGYDYSRNEAILCSLECKLDTLVQSMDSMESVNYVSSISTKMVSIKTNARLGKIDKALKYFKLVSTLLERVDCL